MKGLLSLPLLLLALTAPGVLSAASCTADSDCAASEYCQECFFATDNSNKCAPRVARGGACSGYTACPKRCEVALTCQARVQDPNQPMVADAPGTCCEPVTCPTCAENVTQTMSTDSAGCITSCGCTGGTPVCGSNSRFSECGSACPRTCSNPSPAMCAMVCVASCTCDEGYYLHNGDCILPSACPVTTAEPVTTTANPGDTTTIDPTATGTTADGVPTTQSSIDGGTSMVDPSDAGVLVAGNCVAEYLTSMRDAPLQLVRVVSGTQQVVAGTLYVLDLELSCPDCALFTYNAHIWVRPWLTPSCNVETLSLVSTVDHPSTPAPPTTTTTTPPAPTTVAVAAAAGEKVTTMPPRMMGGRQPADTATADVVAAAVCAVQLENARSNSLFSLQLVQITSVTKQVVAGARYNMVLAAGFSNTCRNDGTARILEQCHVAANAVTSYAASVLVQAWMTPSCTLLSFAAVTETVTTNPPTTAPTTAAAPAEPITTTDATTDTTTDTTTDATTANGNELVGGMTVADVNSAYVQHAALCALTDLNARSNNAYQTQLLQVQAATSQVVAGIKYELTFLAAMSTQCFNDGTAPDLANCPVENNAAQQYKATVIVQAWQPMSCIVQGPATPSVSDEAMAGDSSSGSNKGVIVGVLVGLVALLALIAGVLFYTTRRGHVANPARTPLVNMVDQ